MATEKEILEDLKAVSTLISTQVRTISVSVLALAWLLIVGGSNAPILPHPPNKSTLLWTIVFCVCSMLADYLQYLAGYFSTKRAHAEGSGNNYTFSKSWPSYRLRAIFFVVKQVLLGVAVALIVVALLDALF
jgi:hypothetical protein